MFCKNCGRNISDRAVSCPYCGYGQTVYQQQPYYIHCPNCHGKILSNVPRCGFCGYTLRPQTPYVQPQPQPGGLYQEPVNAGFVILSLLIPLFGIIFGAIKMNEGQKHCGQVYFWCGMGIVIASLLPLIFVFAGAGLWWRW